MGQTILGTCSICGGRVAIPTVWTGIHPPIASCSSCGATKKNPHGQVIEMEKNKPYGQSLEKDKKNEFI